MFRRFASYHRAAKCVRSGSVYILVLFASLLVATIALAALNLQRLQGQVSANRNDFIDARFYARAALEIGMLKIRNDPYWRTDLGNGAWVTNQSIGAGTFSLSAVDPVDGDVTNGNNDPVILTATGIKGQAQYKTSTRLEVGPPVGSCFEVSMIGGTGVSVFTATLTSNQTVSSNQDFNAGSSAVVNANVEATGNVNGQTYTKAQAKGTSARTLPDAVNCFTYYEQNGVAIQYSSLPQWTQPQLLSNTTFETNTAGWNATGSGALAQSSLQHYAGSYSLLLSGRKANTDSMAQDVTSTLANRNGNTLSLSIPLYCAATSIAQAVLTITSSGSGTQTFATPTVNITSNHGNYSWVVLQGNLTPAWTGSLTKATISVAINVTNNFYIDSASMTDVTYPQNAYVIDRVLLSPTNNPLGTRQTNTQGIYVINCSGHQVVLGNSRVVGTLVFVQPGGGSGIQGSVVWEPAVYNFPALLFTDALNIGCTATPLSEATLGVNFNPPGTPYPYVGGTSNSTLTDACPSQINGLVYTSANLTFSGAPTISGVVVANGLIQVNATSLNLSYGNVYLNNAPPGFTSGTITMKEVPGTWQRVVN